jgi:hypothetical protein
MKRLDRIVRLYLLRVKRIKKRLRHKTQTQQEAFHIEILKHLEENSVAMYRFYLTLLFNNDEDYGAFHSAFRELLAEKYIQNTNSTQSFDSLSSYRITWKGLEYLRDLELRRNQIKTNQSLSRSNTVMALMFLTSLAMTWDLAELDSNGKIVFGVVIFILSMMFVLNKI